MGKYYLVPGNGDNNKKIATYKDLYTYFNANSSSYTKCVNKSSEISTNRCILLCDGVVPLYNDSTKKMQAWNSRYAIYNSGTINTNKYILLNNILPAYFCDIQIDPILSFATVNSTYKLYYPAFRLEYYENSSGAKVLNQCGTGFDPIYYRSISITGNFTNGYPSSYIAQVCSYNFTLNNDNSPLSYTYIHFGGGSSSNSYTFSITLDFDGGDMTNDYFCTLNKATNTKTISTTGNYGTTLAPSTGFGFSNVYRSVANFNDYSKIYSGDNNKSGISLISWMILLRIIYPLFGVTPPKYNSDYYSGTFNINSYTCSFLSPTGTNSYMGEFKTSDNKYGFQFNINSFDAVLGINPNWYQLNNYGNIQNDNLIFNDYHIVRNVYVNLATYNDYYYPSKFSIKIDDGTQYNFEKNTSTGRYKCTTTGATSGNVTIYTGNKFYDSNCLINICDQQTEFYVENSTNTGGACINVLNRYI